MIQSFGDKDTETFFISGKAKKGVPWTGVVKIAQRKLDIIDYVSTLNDLRSPPGNRLEALTGNWVGYHSIRINDQWRVVFKWTSQGPEEVMITDYH